MGGGIVQKSFDFSVVNVVGVACVEAMALSATSIVGSTALA